MDTVTGVRPATPTKIPPDAKQPPVSSASFSELTENDFITLYEPPSVETSLNPFLLNRSSSPMADEEKKAHPARKRHCLRKSALWIIPLTSSLSDTGTIVFSITDIRETVLLGFIRLQGRVFTTMLVTLPLLFFSASIVLNSHWTIKGIESSYKILRNKEFPEDWPSKDQFAQSSRYQLLLVLIAGLYVVIPTTFLDGISGYYYLNQSLDDYAPHNPLERQIWLVFAACIGTMQGLTALSSEGIETLRSFYWKLYNHKREYSHTFHKIISLTQDYTVAILGSITNALESYFPFAIIFKIKDPIGQYTLLTSVFLSKFITDYCLSDENSYEAISELFKEVNNETPSWLNRSAFAVALVSGLILADLQRAFFIDLMRNPIGDASLPFALPDNAIQVLGIGRGIRDSINYTVYLLPFYQEVLSLIIKAANPIKQAFCGCKRKSLPRKPSFFKPEPALVPDLAKSLLDTPSLERRSRCFIL